MEKKWELETVHLKNSHMYTYIQQQSMDQLPGVSTPYIRPVRRTTGER